MRVPLTYGGNPASCLVKTPVLYIEILKSYIVLSDLYLGQPSRHNIKNSLVRFTFQANLLTKPDITVDHVNLIKVHFFLLPIF